MFILIITRLDMKNLFFMNFLTEMVYTLSAKTQAHSDMKLVLSMNIIRFPFHRTHHLEPD